VEHRARRRPARVLRAVGVLPEARRDCASAVKQSIRVVAGGHYGTILARGASLCVVAVDAQRRIMATSLGLHVSCDLPGSRCVVGHQRRWEEDESRSIWSVMVSAGWCRSESPPFGLTAEQRRAARARRGKTKRKSPR